MVENLGLQIKEKGKRWKPKRRSRHSPKVLRNCSMLQLHFLPRLHLQFATHLPLLSQKGENHHEWRRKPKEWKSFPTPLATSKRLFKHPKVFLYRAKWGISQTLVRNKFKYPFSTSSPSGAISAPPGTISKTA